MSTLRAAGAILGLAVALAACAGRAAWAQQAPGAESIARSRAAQEARFLRTVDRQDTANLVTGDLAYYTGRHVDYQCNVDSVVRPGVILGQCGSEAEPIDLFVRLPTTDLHAGNRLRILGVMESPVSWTDVTGHNVYFAFLRAIFVDRLPD
jgi:hypothetical protein